MESKTNSTFWWMKTSKPCTEEPKSAEIQVTLTSTPRQDTEISSSLAEFVAKERDFQNLDDTETDIGSIIEEIHHLAAQSPLGPYEKETGERSIEEIMKEAERIYLESSKSFEQLSSRSKTSVSLTDMLNSHRSQQSTPTPKSASPLPLDTEKTDKSSKPVEEDVESESYSDDFVDYKSDVPSTKNSDHGVEFSSIVVYSEPPTTSPVPVLNSNCLSTNTQNVVQARVDSDHSAVKETIKRPSSPLDSAPNNTSANSILNMNSNNEPIQKLENVQSKSVEVQQLQEEIAKRDNVIQEIKDRVIQKEEAIYMLQGENKFLKDEINNIKTQLLDTNLLLEKAKGALNSQGLRSPEVNIELEKALEEVKDAKETNTGLNLQLESLNRTHQFLKNSYEELLTCNKNLERRVVENETSLAKYKNEFLSVQMHRDRLLETEANLSKYLEIEKLHTKTMKLQNEKDSRCIMDLNRQIKEMERIITRKHPDSVSALIVAAKSDQSDTGLTARRVLEDRIKSLESEVSTRDAKSSKVFLDVQEKFNHMKVKYESHIEDLELHVSDLKNQLKRRIDTYDVYTQTFSDEQKILGKDTRAIAVQTTHVANKLPKVAKKHEKHPDGKEETHLLATIRGLQADLANKEKVITKLLKEADEVKKTNKRLQKEREGSLKLIAERRECRSYPEKLALQARSEESIGDTNAKLEDELKAMKSERDKMKSQLCRIEEDYQSLKTKRLLDLNTLQEAHEREISTYLSNITPLREQLEIQQVTISTLQKQLCAAKEELAILTVERDHLNNRLEVDTAALIRDAPVNGNPSVEEEQLEMLQKKIVTLERNYEEREQRLRAIVHGLAQKNVTNRSCEQCAYRQQQLIAYKAELDQLLATVRAIT